MEPDFIIIGAPRSGTTTLHRHLADHPEVGMARGKEVRYFTRNFEKGPDWYSEQFPSGDHLLLGEATPQYMQSAVAMARLDEACPRAALIAALRDPVERANSHFHHLVARGLETRSIREAIVTELDDPESATVPYIGYGRYGEQLERISALRGDHRLHVIFFEDLASEPGPTLQALADFLGVRRFTTPHDLRVNSADSFRSV